MSGQRHVAAMVAVGSAAGACARYGLGTPFIGANVMVGVPWGTLAANVAGSVLIGLYAALRGPRSRWPARLREQALVMSGFCGGFTTFSLFTAEVGLCLQRQQWALAAVLLCVSVVAWLAGVSGGYATGLWLARRMH